MKRAAITLFAVMVAVAGYVHFTRQEVEEAQETVNSETESENETNSVIKELDAQDTEESKVEIKEDENLHKTGIGDAVLVNASVSADYFYTQKLNREQLRAKNKESLMEIINNDKAKEEVKEEAQKELINMTRTAGIENDIETLLSAKGYENCVVTVGTTSADVIVDASMMTSQDAAIIEDTVIRKTGFKGKDIVITPANGQ